MRQPLTFKPKDNQNERPDSSPAAPNNIHVPTHRAGVQRAIKHVAWPRMGSVMIDYTEWLYQSLDYLQYVEMFESDFNWGDVLYAEPLNDDN